MSLQTLISNISNILVSNNDFKYLTVECGSKNLELLKQKELILMNT